MISPEMKFCSEASIFNFGGRGADLIMTDHAASGDKTRPIIEKLQQSV